MDGDRLAADRAADAALVERVRAGDERAFGELYDRWVDRVHDLAFRIVGEDAADVAHDVFLAAWRNLDSLRDPASFGGWLLRSARNAALNRLERDRRASPTDTQGFAVIESSGQSGADAPSGFGVEGRLGTADDPARAVEDAELIDLVWESASALGERDATVLDLTLRHGLTPAEVGEVVGVNRNAANQLVHRVRTRLGDAVRARVLWNGGDPRCGELAAELTDAGVTRFGADTVRVTASHVEGCEACDERRRLRLSPAAMFSALPFVGVPVLVNEQVAAALAAEGVPMAGSVTHPGGARHQGASEGSGDHGGRAEEPPTEATETTEPTRIIDAEVSTGPVPIEETSTIVAPEAIAALIADEVASDEVASEVESDDGAPKLVARHWPKLVAAAAILVLGLVLLVAGLPGGSDGESLVAVGIDPEALTTATLPPEPDGSPPDVTVPPDPADAPAPAPEEAPSPPESPPGSPPGSPPTAVPPSPAVEITARIDDAPVQSIYTRADAPRLVWSVVGGSTVEVSGPGMAISTARSGEEPLCPTEPPGWQTCTYVAGQWTYQVRVRDAAGALLAEEAVVLTRA